MPFIILLLGKNENIHKERKTCLEKNIEILKNKKRNSCEYECLA